MCHHSSTSKYSSTLIPTSDYRGESTRTLKKETWGLTNQSPIILSLSNLAMKDKFNQSNKVLTLSSLISAVVSMTIKNKVKRVIFRSEQIRFQHQSCMQSIADPSQRINEEIRIIDVGIKCLELIHTINVSWIEYLLHFFGDLLSRWQVNKRFLRIFLWTSSLW